MIPDRKQQLFQLTCLQEARRQAKAGQKFSPIKLRSLKDARFQVKSTRPESVTRLSESYSKFDSLNDELRRRTVISLSPTASSEQLELTPRGTLDRDFLVNESKEESPAPMFNDLIKHDLPEIDEAQNVEDVQDEERKIEDLDRRGKISLERNKDCELQFKGKNIGKEKEMKAGNGNGGQRLAVKKQIVGKGIVKRKVEDVLEFMEEEKIKKKLTKSQERGLLDRLQGFSTKFLNSNR